MRDAAGGGLDASTSPTQKALHARSALRRHALRLPLLALIASVWLLRINPRPATQSASPSPVRTAHLLTTSSPGLMPTPCCLYPACFRPRYGPYTGLVDKSDEVGQINHLRTVTSRFPGIISGAPPRRPRAIITCLSTIIPCSVFV